MDTAARLSETVLLTHLKFSCDFYSYKDLVILELHLKNSLMYSLSKYLQQHFAKDEAFNSGITSNHEDKIIKHTVLDSKPR